MSDNHETDFFDGVGGGAGSPRPILKNPGDGVIGTIVEMFKRDYVPYENRKSREPLRDDDGKPVQQLVIILQTDHRGWQNVHKVPRVDPQDEDSPEKDPSEDDGKRAIYVPQRKNIQFAIGRAVTAAGEKPRVGGRLGVKIVDLKDTGQGEPMKEHEAVYYPPSAGDTFFEQPQQAPAQQSAPAPQAPPQQAQQPAQAAPQQDPWAMQAPAQQQAAPAAQQDPWATSQQPATKAPPF